ncbi:hypothetical protein FACS189411_07310 [Bacteroidia bacterium]|nr:hypothetical protein FACS189411_07310 [Bacteroidia bacterium]
MNTKQLRQKILDLAIRGKLVPQDPNDEPASVLVAKIRAEKERLIKEKKIKRDKNESFIFYGEDKSHYEKFVDGTVKCIEDEIPFEIPENWEWCRLGNIAFYKKGPFGSSITKSMFIPKSDVAIKVYEQKNAIYKDALIGNYYISPERFNELKGFEVFPHDIIVSCAGTIGESYIMPSNIRKGIINQALMRIKLYDNRMIDFYLMYFDFVLKNEAIKKGNGTAMKNIPSFDVLKQFLMPIPPINEQFRILSFLKTIENLVSSVEMNKDDINMLIKQAKAKVLDLAIHGKLVPQNPNDEPASVLLERIKAEQKTKKQTADISHYPFVVPESWAWCKLEDVFQITMGQSPDGTSVTNNDSGVEFHQGKINFGEMYLENSNLYTDEPTRIAEANSLLLCVRAPVGILNITTRKICIGRGLCAIQTLNKIDLFFAYYWLKTLESTFNLKATGSTFTAISGDIIKNEIIPLPPLYEQKRIVNKIESIFKTLDSIQNHL